MRAWTMLAALLLATSCRHHRPSEPQPSLADCLAGERLGIAGFFIGDPHGQGRDLLGLGFMDVRTFVRVDRFDVHSIASRAGDPITDVQIRSRALTGVNGRTAASLGVSDWTGAVIVGQLHCSNPKLKGKTRNIQARILEVVPDATPLGPLEQRLWMAYKLELLLEDGRRFADVCRDPGDVAFPIVGYWNDAGDYVRDPKKFSFACTRRHVATCVKQGYLDSAGSAAGDRVALLEACTRMMRADYCGNGASHTKDGTFISLWDNRNIAAEQHVAPLAFEAAWNRKGMVCIARPRWSEAEVGVPPCLRDKPRCSSAREAAALAPEEPLVFNESCIEHPCRVDLGRVEPFAGTPPIAPDPRPCPDGDKRGGPSSVIGSSEPAR